MGPQQDHFSAAGFDTMGAARSCAQGWQFALEITGAKLAAAADKVNLNADSYARTDQGNAGRFRGPQ